MPAIYRIKCYMREVCRPIITDRLQTLEAAKILATHLNAMRSDGNKPVFCFIGVEIEVRVGDEWVKSHESSMRTRRLVATDPS